MPTSTQIEKKLSLARIELKKGEKQLLEKKELLIRGIEAILPKFIDKAITTVVSCNAARIDQMSVDELRKMKEELEGEKPIAIQTGATALRTSPDWLSCFESGMTAPRAAIDQSGLSQFGPIWKAFENYSRSLESVFARYGLKVGDDYQNALKPMILHRQAVLVPNRAVGDAHVNYCVVKYRCDSLEESLREAKAREKFESA